MIVPLMVANLSIIKKWCFTHFFIRLKLDKNQAKVKQHPKAELLLFANYLLSWCTLSSKIMGHILKNVLKSKCICFKWVYFNYNENQNEKKIA